MRVFIILAFLLYSITSFAEVHFLSLIENDNNPEVFTLSLETDTKDQFTTLIQTRYQDLEQFELGNPVEIIKVNEQQLSAGVILYKQQGFDIIRLQAESIDVKRGGSARMYYKSNVLTQRSWKRNKSQLLKVINAGGSWYAAQENEARINHAFFKTGSLGIKRIQYSYRPELDQ